MPALALRVSVAAAWGWARGDFCDVGLLHQTNLLRGGEAIFVVTFDGPAGWRELRRQIAAMPEPSALIARTRNPTVRGWLEWLQAQPMHRDNEEDVRYWVGYDGARRFWASARRRR